MASILQTLNYLRHFTFQKYLKLLSHTALPRKIMQVISFNFELHFQSIQTFVRILNQFAVWQEAFQNGQGQLSKKAIVHVWKKEDWQNVTLEVYNQKTASRKFLMKIILGYKRGYASPIVRSLVPQLHFLWHRLAQLLQNRPTRLQWF